MEYTMNNGFAELSATEMENTDGGVIGAVLIIGGAFVVGTGAGFGIGYLLG